MKANFEEDFINNFINKQYRNRLLFELKSSKKRINALMRFSHNIDDLIKKEKVSSKLKNFEESELKSFLKENKFYVLSFKHLEGCILEGNDVLEYISEELSPVIVCGTNIAVLKKEFEKGTFNFYLLKK